MRNRRAAADAGRRHSQPAAISSAATRPVVENTRPNSMGIEDARILSYATQHLEETARVVSGLDAAAIEKIVTLLADLRSRGGRLFFLGVGGGAANCSHAVNDFRKIARIEAYAPTDNVSELTARTNDEGWETVFEAWLRTSRLRSEDALLG